MVPTIFHYLSGSHEMSKLNQSMTEPSNRLHFDPASPLTSSTFLLPPTFVDFTNFANSITCVTQLTPFQ